MLGSHPGIMLGLPAKLRSVDRDRWLCFETHLGGRGASAFVLPLATAARSLSSTFVASTALTLPNGFWPHSRDHCRSLTLTCQNSPRWRSCEHCNKFTAITDSIDRSIDRAYGHHVTCVLIGMSCNASLAVLVPASCQLEATRSAVAPRNTEKKFALCNVQLYQLQKNSPEF